MNLVEEVAQSAPIPENKTSISFKLDSFEVVVMNLNKDTFQGQDFSITARNGTVTDEDATFEMSTAAASLSIPDNILRNVNSSDTSSSIRIVIVAYLNDSLFARRDQRNDSEVGSIVLAASLSLFNSNGEVERLKVMNLDPPIQLIFSKRAPVRSSANTTCNFWDFSADGENVAHFSQIVVLG